MRAPPLRALLLLTLLGLLSVAAGPAAAHVRGERGEPHAPLAPSAAATPEQRAAAARRAAVIATLTPEEHRQDVAAAWADSSGALRELDVHPSILVGLAILAGLYALGVGPLRRRFRWSERGVQARQVAWFAGSLVVLLLMLNGPVHHLSDYYLLSAHMVQHMVLALVFPPMLLAGIPGWLLSPLLRRPFWFRLGRWFTHPLTAYLLFNASLVGWHLPPAYELALRNHDAHIAQHLMFLVAAVLVWWPVAGVALELPRLTYFWQILYLFLLQIPMVALGAFMTLASAPLYPFYAAAPRLLPGFSALLDQQLAGLFMWLPGHLVLWLPMGILFFRWVAAQDDDASGLSAPPQPAAVAR